MNRRSLLISTAGLVGAAALAGCSGATSDQLSNDVNLLVNGLSAVVVTLSDPALKVPAATLAQINAVLADLQSNAAAIGNALTPNTNTVQAIGNAVSALAALATPFFPLSSVVAMVVQAALALVPTILSFVHAPVPAGAAANSMNADQARLVLKAAPAMLSKH